MPENREYQRRAARQAMEQVGASLVLDNSGFYRFASYIKDRKRAIAAKRASTCGKLQGVQLSLFPVEPSMQVSRIPTDPEKPLFDLFPEAYLK